MTDENPTATVVSQSKLSDIVWQVESAPSAFTDRWLGKRFDARTALAVPVWLQPWTEAGQSPPEQYTIRDISLSGIGIYAHRAMQHDDMVLARFGINSTCWSGPMRVRHCTETVGGYKIGLEALEETARCPERRTHQSEGLWPKPSSGESLKPASLARIKAEARKVAQAYHLARFSWGLLGLSVRNRIFQIIEDLSPQARYEPAHGKRKRGRTLVDTGTSVVFRLPHSWRQTSARIVDVSRAGVGLTLSPGLIEHQAERELSGDLEVRVGMTLIVGLGCEPHRLWIPGEIMNCTPMNDGRIRAGIQFATPTSQSMFDNRP